MLLYRSTKRHPQLPKITMKYNYREHIIISVVFTCSYILYLRFSGQAVLLSDLLVEFLIGLLSSNLIPFVNKVYLTSRYEGLSYEKLCDKSRFFYDTLAVIFIGIIVTDISLLPIPILTSHPFSLIEVQFSQVVIVLICVSYSFIYHTFLYTNLYITQNVKLEKIAQQKISSDIKYLQSQFSPQLIFNTLEFVENQAMLDKSLAQKTLDQFSNILRYKIYEVNRKAVLVKDEITYIQKYADFLSTLEQADIIVSTTPPRMDLRIKPLMLNAFIDYIISIGCKTFSISSKEETEYSITFTCYFEDTIDHTTDINTFFNDIRYKEMIHTIGQRPDSLCITFSFAE